MKKIKFATTKDLNHALKVILEECKVGDGARIEVFIEDDKSEKRYGVVGMSHYHAIPNLVLTIKEIKDNYAK